MSATIITRTIGAVVDQRTSVIGSNIFRLHGVGTWATLRVGMRCILNGAASFGAPSYFFLGFCNGTANTIFTSTNFIGLLHDNNGFTYHAAAGANAAYYSPNVNLDYPIKIVAGVGTLGVGLAANLNFPADPTTATRRMIFFEVTKNPPNWDINFFRPTGIPAAAQDVTTADFLSTVIMPAPAFAGHTWGAMTALAFDEVAGAVNAVGLYWTTSGASVPIEICDIAVVKLA